MRRLPFFDQGVATPVMRAYAPALETGKWRMHLNAKRRRQ
jgi:hypothetical protein